MKTRLALLGAFLLPAVAFAQPADPNAPAAPQTPQTPQTPQAPQTTQAPAVVINPPAPAMAPSVIETNEPAYEEVYDSYNATMFTTGALVFAASYGASVITAASSDDNDRGNHRLYVPVVGPWLALNDRGSCDVSQSRCDHETTAKVLLVADGVFQAAGLLGMLDGVLQPSSHRVMARTAKLDTKVHVTPTVAQGPGVAVFGRF